MVNDGLFGPWGQIILYSTIAVALIAAILIVACFVTPGCIGFECVRPRRKAAKAPALKYNGKPNDNLKLSDVSYRSWRLGSLYETENGTVGDNSISPRESINSNNSQFEVDTTSVLNLVQPKQKNGHKKDKKFPTEITISLRYLPHCEGITSSKLVIGVEAVSGLPPKQYNCPLEPYVVLEIFKQSWTNRKKQRLYAFKTKGVRHTANPIFRESFVITAVSQQEIKDWVLNIEVHDHDRYANHTKMCELQVPLQDAKKIFLSPETHLFNYQMKSAKQEYGNILLGVSYLPTAQRLTINIMKLRNIKYMTVVPSINEFNPFVRVLMLNGKTGRRIKKKKTKCIRGTGELEFNETLTFDLPSSQIDTLQFLIILCSKVTPDESTPPMSMMNELPSDSEDSVSSYRRPKDVCIGKVALGKGVRDSTQRLHWFSVLQNPRKLVTVWHSLN